MSGRFLWIVLAMAIYGGIHSWLASSSTKDRAIARFGPAINRFYRLFFNIFAILSFLPVLWLVGSLPDQYLYTIPSPWRILTGLMEGLAALGLLVGVLQTGALSFLGIKQLYRPEHSTQPPGLVINGLYRWVRHPLYTCGLLFIWLTPYMSLNLLAFNLAMTLYVLIGIRFEERKLLSEFGEAYSSYRNTTPMLIPGLAFNRN